MWSYIEQEQIEIPSIYFSHKRKVFLRDEWFGTSHTYTRRRKRRRNWRTYCSFRTVGDIGCTAAVDSYAATISEVKAKLIVNYIYLRVLELMINVRQRWRKENNKELLGWSSWKYFWVYFFLVGVKAQTEKNVDKQSLLWAIFNQLEL
jgi:3'-phosphoadenosine 5'-phosphosulfate sulfotransferase (PAPS reductase)/FAD synthetase